VPARSNGLLDGLTGGILIARHQSSLKDREPGDSQDGDQKQSHASPQRSQEAQHHAIAVTGNETPATILVEAVDVIGETLHGARQEQARQSDCQEQASGESCQRHSDSTIVRLTSNSTDLHNTAGPAYLAA
jgi:hypothetical protein